MCNILFTSKMSSEDFDDDAIDLTRLLVLYPAIMFISVDLPAPLQKNILLSLICHKDHIQHKFLDVIVVDLD